MESFIEIAQQVMKTKEMTPEIEQQINRLLWSSEFNAVEMSVLYQFYYMLNIGLIKINSNQPSRTTQNYLDYALR